MAGKTEYERLQRRREQRQQILRDFLDAECLIGKEYKQNSPELYEAYCRWAERSGFEAAGRHAFGYDIMRLIPHLYFKNYKVSGTKLFRARYIGVALKKGNARRWSRLVSDLRHHVVRDKAKAAVVRPATGWPKDRVKIAFQTRGEAAARRLAKRLGVAKCRTERWLTREFVA